MTTDRQKHTIELLKQATDSVLHNSHPKVDTARDELVNRAKEAAYRLLSVRDRSSFELQSRLSDKGFSSDIVDETLESLTNVGLLDDEKFARTWVHQRVHYNARGEKLLRQELRQKGISEELIQQVLEEIPVDVQNKSARELVEKRARRIRPEKIASREGYQKEKRRLYNMLLRRGYGYDLASQLSDEVLKNKAEEANKENLG
ncbi:MAG: regulatory protein RecX [Lawsonella sp.]